MAKFKQVTVQDGSKLTTMYQPVVLTFELTPEQQRIVAKFTGQQKMQLELTEAELKTASLFDKL
jgi:hypothetical protein